MAYKTGDRVRVCKPDSEYTGCRGSIADDQAAVPIGVTPMGHYVAIDGENGVVRPFLVQDLEPLRPAVVRRPFSTAGLNTHARSERRENR